LFAPHIYGVVLRAHSVRGEPRIQLNASEEVATLLKLLKAVFTTLPFLTSWPTWLNVIGHFKINSVDDWKKPGKNSVQNSQRVYPRNLWKKGDPRRLFLVNLHQYPPLLTKVGGNEWKQTTKREHSWFGYDCCIAHQNSVMDFSENKSCV